MSFANICDRCGKVIGDRRDDAEYMAVAVLVDGEMAYSLEDACDSCRKELARAIDAFAHPVPCERSVPAEKADGVPSPAGDEPPAREAAEEKPPAPQEASEDDAPERPARMPVDPDSLPNAVVRRFPLPIPEV